MHDKATLEAHLQRLVQDSTALQAMAVNNQRETEQLNARLNQLAVEREQTRGAASYNAKLIEILRGQLSELEKASVPPVSA